MTRLSLVAQKLVALFLMGVVLLTFPVIGLFSGGEDSSLIAGVPSLFIWIYGVWAVLIGLAAWLIERSRDSRRRAE